MTKQLKLSSKGNRCQALALGMMFLSYLSIYFVRKPFSVVKAGSNCSVPFAAKVESSPLWLCQ